jgi:hypothetical protein
MRKFIKTFVISATFVSCIILKAGAADTVSINRLIDNISSYDKQQVTVEGEAIGEALERGGYAWVNINDTTNAIGIWLTSEDAGKIAVFGDYKHTGDTIRITGTFSRDCKEHGGDVDIHCSRIEIISTGHAVGETIDHEKVIVTVILFCAALTVTIIFLIVRKPKEPQK